MKYIKSINENLSNVVMYYFNPNDYGEQFMVVSNSKEEAFNSVIKHIKEEIEISPTNYYNDWLESTVDTLPNGYTIDIYNIGDVLSTEIC